MKTIQQLSNAADMLEMAGVLKKWRKIKESQDLSKITYAFKRIVSYLQMLEAENNYMTGVLSDLRFDKNKELLTEFNKDLTLDKK